MIHGEINLEGLSGFEKLDAGELYFIASRTYVERGLMYYRQFAVEALEWDEAEKTMTASVEGRRNRAYEVNLQVAGGKLIHECDCPNWHTYKSCKHVVAAAAAMYLAVQGRCVGGYDMPADYAQDLRQQLGYTDVGGEAANEDASSVDMPATEIYLEQISSYGGLEFEIEGPIPKSLLKSIGIDLSNSFGFHVDRSFSLSDADAQLGKFLTLAVEQGISVFASIDGDTERLLLQPNSGAVMIEYDYSSEEVERRLMFVDSEGVRIEPFALVPGSSYLIARDGAVYHIALESDEPLEDTGPLDLVEDVEAFNERAYLMNYAFMRRHPDLFVFKIKGRRETPEVLDAEAVRYELDLTAMENAAGECEALEFDLCAYVKDECIDLYAMQSMLMESVLHAYGGTLLSAKRRVQAMCDLVRRVVSSGATEDALNVDPYVADFEELFSTDYRSGTMQLLRNLLNVVAGPKTSELGLAVDRDSESWLAAPLDTRKLAMLLFSISDVASRNDLHGLEEGSIAVRRGASSVEAVQRIVSVCSKLGVSVQFNSQPIRSEPLSISVDTKASGSDIDWFELHPSIRCGERTIQQSEWQELLQGRLLWKDENGGLVMPQMDSDQSGGLEALADLLGARPEKDSQLNEAVHEGLQISRLEMLDWILLRRHGVQVELPAEAEALFKNLSNFDGIDSYRSPKMLNAKLRPYQEEGVAWIDFLYRHRFGACLADDMGLGKTVQTIAFLANRFESGLASRQAPVLIVLPPSLVFNWLDEFERFAPEIQVEDCLAKSQWKHAMSRAQVILSTYDRVRLDLDEFKDHSFDIVVFDEAHNLKSVSAARTKAAAKVNRRFTLCLTGTPVENNASEFYSVMSAAVPGLFGTLKAFKEYFRTSPDMILGRSRPFILRRTKDKILKELPKKEEHELFLEMSPVQKEIYTRTVAEVREEVAEAYEDRPEQQAGIVALAAILRLRQVCVSPELLGKHMDEPAPKFEYMADKLEVLQAERHAALVFSQFIGGLDQMEAVAKARGIPYLRMDGRTPVAMRKDLVREFQSGEGPRFFFISLKTGGVGLNLTQANYVFHLDPWWNPAVENQASDRAHRIGQKRSVFVQRLIMQHSIEARMLELKARKAELFKRLVEEPGAKAATAGLNRDDFDYLLNG